MNQHQLALVAVDSPIQEPLTYEINSEIDVVRGDTVIVPLGQGNRNVKGLVVSTSFDKVDFEMKQIISIDNECPRLQENFIRWLEWISEYYIYPLGKVAQLCFPPLKKTVKARASQRPQVIPDIEIKPGHQLSEEQLTCVNSISEFVGFSTHLVHGVTGSGKTEVYLELFEKTLKQGKKGIFLLPEISLTPQLIQRFAQRFGNRIAVLHSQLTDRERTNQWWEIIEGKKDILVGARSALFCPIENLGLIVVDEEHETSFKQDEKLKYNGRDCAIMLGKFMNCPVILGSATPSIDSWKNVVDKKFHLHQLKSRVANRPLPDIQVVDMRLEKDLEKKSSEKPFWLSQTLYESMHLHLEQKNQIALLLNRRGMAHMLFCPDCGYTVDCPNCDISLTLHANTHLVCHYCDYHENAKSKCPDCKDGQLITMGLGTEKVEEDLIKLFPDHVIARADRDEVQSRIEMEELVQKMEKGEIDILIGTQMIAKGLDFPKLKLVGLILADVSFNLPDFRAAEKSFQLITQMSGRSGRHVGIFDEPGQVIIQTYNTSHDAIQFSQQHNYEGFVQNELMHRQQLNYPPFHKMASVRFQSMDLNKAKSAAHLFSQRAFALKEKFPQFDVVEVLGPAASPIAKLRNQYRFHILLKCGQHKILNQFIRRILSDSKWIPSQAKILIDVDPQNLL